MAPHGQVAHHQGVWVPPALPYVDSTAIQSYKYENILLLQEFFGRRKFLFSKDPIWRPVLEFYRRLLHQPCCLHDYV